MTKTFYIKCDYGVETGSHNEEGDGSAYSGFSHEVYVDHEFQISDKKMNYPDQTYTTDLETAYILAILYGDGGTFGRTDGYIAYYGPFSSFEEAEKVFKRIKELDGNGYTYHLGRKARDKKREELQAEIGYCPWMSYFGSYEGCFILDSDGGAIRHD